MHEAYVNAKHVVTDSTAILKKPTPDVRSLYDFGQVLGKGQFGTTRCVGPGLCQLPLCPEPRCALRTALKHCSSV
jgi:hypothetical protein